MRRILLLVLLGVLAAPNVFGFCGFYVARAGAELFNEASQVIVVRGQNRTVITMSNDFRGSAQEFAMVVPVPTVLQRDQIKIANQSVFDYLDAYSGPRLVEYHDANPCQVYAEYNQRFNRATAAPTAGMADANTGIAPNLGVRIEASYTVGEYDILILSATQAAGLKTWLTQNGYSIPPQAEEVLEPYIRSNLKFFVVKVNLQEMTRGGYTKLRPLQISFESEKFMLPIRLGMANSTGWQDLIVYCFSDRGRVEPVNYPLAQIPTDQDIPNTLKPRFGEFYASLFGKAWERNEKRAVLLEYFWDISSTNYNHCDPCNTTPPDYTNLTDAGVFWLSNGGGGSSSASYNGNVYITRLHVRYNRELYPEDLMFQVTPGNGNFQGRYVMHHPATGDMTCEAGQAYLRELKVREARERRNLSWLTGWAMGNIGNTPGDNTRDHDGLPIIGGGGSDGPSTPGADFLEYITPSMHVDAPRVDAPWLQSLPRVGMILGLLAMMAGLFIWRRRALLRARALQA